MKVFISHSHKDSELVESIKQKLLKQDLEVLEIDPHPGEDITNKIEKAIRDADFYFIILSKSYEDSKWADLEQLMILDETFSKKKKQIFPILIDKNARIPSLLKSIVYADLTNKDSRDSKLEKLLFGILNQDDSKNISTYKRMKYILKEKEELLRLEELEYKLQREKQDRLRSLFKMSFILVTIASFIIAIVFLTDGIKDNSILGGSIKIESLIFYLLGFLTAIIPSLIFIVKAKAKYNGK